MSASMTTTEIIQWTIHPCPECGVRFGVTEHYDKKRRSDGRSFYCPNGHSMSFAETEADRLRKKLAAAEGNLKHARERGDRYLEQAEREKRRHAATKGQLTKTKKRVAGGACPCCNRSFVDLARHMATKHPSYAGEPS